MKRREIRRETGRLVLTGTLLFALLLALGLFGRSALPAWRQQRAQSALEAGDTRTARRLAKKMDETELSTQLLERCDYLDAKALMEQGRWDEATALLDALGAYEDAQSLGSECRYQSALRQKEEGAYAEAAELFRALGAYRDAPEQAAQCRYQQALQAIQQGDKARAALLLAALGDYADARERAEALACELTGLRDGEAALARLNGLSEEDLALREKLAEARQALPACCVATGFYHTLGCRSDGRVLACGDDSFGQCRTEDWTGMCAVAAGAYHSLGLRTDGTVAAVGRSEEGQCEVEGWTQVVAIAAGDYASFGLRADGTLLCAGRTNAALESWSGAAAITAGSYAFGALLSDGSTRIAPGSLETESLTELAALAVSTGCAVGLRSDGTVVSDQLDAQSWSGILAISLSPTRLLGLDEEGKLHCLSFRPSDRLDTQGLDAAVAVADSGTHAAIVFRDGSVRVLGAADRGQGDTQSWKLF